MSGKKSGKTKRFKPPLIITRQLLDAETPSVFHEIDNLLICSTVDLRAFVKNRHAQVEDAHRELESLLPTLPIRERLAVVAMVNKEIFVAMALMNVTILKHFQDVMRPTWISTPVEDIKPSPISSNESLFPE